MSPVAVAADSTTYLPRELASREGVAQISLYVGWKDESTRELDLPSFDAFYERLRTDPELPTTSRPCSRSGSHTSRKSPIEGCEVLGRSGSRASRA